MRQLLRQRQGLVEAGQGLRRVPQQPERYRGIGLAGDTQIEARAEYQGTALVWRVAGDACLQVQAGSRQRAKEEPCCPQGIVGDDRERGVIGRLRQTQQGVPELACPVVICRAAPRAMYRGTACWVRSEASGRWGTRASARRSVVAASR